MRRRARAVQATVIAESMADADGIAGVGRDEQRGTGSASGMARLGREYRVEPSAIDPAEAVMPAVSSAHDVAESEYEPKWAGQTDLAPVEVLEPEAQHEAEFEEAISSLHADELQEAIEPEFHETTAEYEPEENASASFRVDPAGRAGVPAEQHRGRADCGACARACGGAARAGVYESAAYGRVDLRSGACGDGAWRSDGSD